MKFGVVFVALFAVAVAAPLDDPKKAEIISYETDFAPIGGYTWSIETSDGKSAKEVGTLKNFGADKDVITVSGQYKYTGSDGVVYEVNYVADENGFQPTGTHLQVA